MEDFYVFCGFFRKLIYDFYLSETTVQNCNLAGCAPVGVGPLEVRFAHPVRLSPATHSQGHGRPCLQRLHPRRGFSATWSLLMDISMQCDSPCAIKRFNAHAGPGITFEKPRRGRWVEPALAPEKRGPAQWGGPAEFSVPTRGFCCHVLNS